MNAGKEGTRAAGPLDAGVVAEMLPVLPSLATEVGFAGLALCSRSLTCISSRDGQEAQAHLVPPAVFLPRMDF